MSVTEYSIVTKNYGEDESKVFTSKWFIVSVVKFVITSYQLYKNSKDISFEYIKFTRTVVG